MNAADGPSFAEYIKALGKKLAKAGDDEKLFEAIVNAPFSDKSITVPLGLGVVVLLLVNKDTNTIDRIALSRTESAQGAVDYSVKPFHEIKIPLRHKKNILAATVDTGRWHQTDDWQYMFIPALTPEEARFNQAGAGIGCSVVYPLKARDGGAMIFSYFKPLWEIEEQHHNLMKAYSDLASEYLGRKQ